MGKHAGEYRQLKVKGRHVTDCEDITFHPRSLAVSPPDPVAPIYGHRYVLICEEYFLWERSLWSLVLGEFGALVSNKRKITSLQVWVLSVTYCQTFLSNLPLSIKPLFMAALYAWHLINVSVMCAREHWQQANNTGSLQSTVTVLSLSLTFCSFSLMTNGRSCLRFPAHNAFSHAPCLICIPRSSSILSVRIN